LQNLKHQIEKRFVTWDRVEQEFARAVSAVEEEQHLSESLDQTTRTLTCQVQQRMLEETLPVFETEWVDAQLIRSPDRARIGLTCRQLCLSVSFWLGWSSPVVCKAGGSRQCWAA
jgi:hypothetical protein